MGDLIKLVPYEFASKRVTLTWAEILTAIKRKMVARQFAIEWAMAELAVKDQYPTALLELASLSKNDDIYPFIEQLAEQQQLINNDKLLFLVLSWLYETKDSYDDPLAVVETIYADFNYPSSICEFVRYMPCDEADLGCADKNHQRLIDKWKSFIDQQSQVFCL